MVTELRFVNRAGDLGETAIVLFQRNAAACSPDRDVVWHSVRYCQAGWQHPIEYPDAIAVGTSDAFGNFSPAIPCDGGESFEIRPTVAGRCLANCRTTRASQDIVVTNRLSVGAVNVEIYRGRRVVARRRNLPPAASASFRFEPELWIGATTAPLGYDFVPTVGKLRCAARLSLRNVRAADIVMTFGPSVYEPLSFELANIHSG